MIIFIKQVIFLCMHTNYTYIYVNMGIIFFYCDFSIKNYARINVTTDSVRKSAVILGIRIILKMLIRRVSFKV